MGNTLEKMPANRVVAIDIFRALTMMMMIWVNDFWTLSGVPMWLEHAAMNEDRMGLSDWVFPGFLFIVGLSIPFAVNARKRKGDSNGLIFKHIIIRSFALIIMGFFMVNLENINAQLIPISKYVWQFLMATAILLIWNIYADKKALGKIPEWILQGIGILILIYLAIVYKGGDLDSPTWMKPHWWGILGIIGWAYLLCATLFLIIGHRLSLIVIFFLLFQAFNALEFIDVFGFNAKFVVSASNHASIMGGVLISLIYIKYGHKADIQKFMTTVFILALLLIIYGFLTRPVWEISKIRATPSWTSISMAISMFAFLGVFILTDVLKKRSWAAIISPAGRSTLTCYLVPYFYYAIMALIGIYLPTFLRTGILGLFKSLLFAFLIVFVTGLLERINIKLKV